MGMNEWFTGLGLGYDPTHNVTTGKEWLVRSLFSWDKFSLHIFLCILGGTREFCRPVWMLPTSIYGAGYEAVDNGKVL